MFSVLDIYMVVPWVMTMFSPVGSQHFKQRNMLPPPSRFYFPSFTTMLPSIYISFCVSNELKPTICDGSDITIVKQ